MTEDERIKIDRFIEGDLSAGLTVIIDRMLASVAKKDDKPLNSKDGMMSPPPHYVDVGVGKDVHARCLHLAKALGYTIDQIYAETMRRGIDQLFCELQGSCKGG